MRTLGERQREVAAEALSSGFCEPQGRRAQAAALRLHEKGYLARHGWFRYTPTTKLKEAANGAP